MIFYCPKKEAHYDSPQVRIVGPVEASIRAITGYGFFRPMIHVDDGGAIPTNRPFVVSESICADRPGETVDAKQFARFMDARKIEPERVSVATNGSVEPAPPCRCDKPKRKSGPTRCRWAKPGETITPCRGRKITCLHPDLLGVSRAEISCRPPDPAQNFEYNLRSCILHAY